MPALTSTQAVTQKRDGRAFDDVSDAVDEGWYPFFGRPTPLIVPVAEKSD